MHSYCSTQYGQIVCFLSNQIAQNREEAYVRDAEMFVCLSSRILDRGFHSRAHSAGN